jgi:hypothetical protein
LCRIFKPISPGTAVFKALFISVKEKEYEEGQLEILSNRSSRFLFLFSAELWNRSVCGSLQLIQNEENEKLEGVS